MGKYEEILRHFQINTPATSTISYYSFVSLDNVHDAIIKVGVMMDKPLSFYITKCKQIALNDIATTKNRANILEENVAYFLHVTPEFMLYDYEFTCEELTVVIEILGGIPKSKSVFTRKKYNSLLPDIYQKLIE